MRCRRLIPGKKPKTNNVGQREASMRKNAPFQDYVSVACGTKNIELNLLLGLLSDEAKSISG